jgi:Hint domain
MHIKQEETGMGQGMGMIVRSAARATFVISWAQTTIGGQAAGPVQALVPGAIWRWTGPVARLDGPDGPLILGADALEALRRKAAASVRRMLRQALSHDAGLDDPDELPRQGFLVTDGKRRYAVRLVHSRETGARMAMFQGDLPPRGQNLRIVRANLDPRAGLDGKGGMICFTPGTLLATANGLCRIDDLRPGDLVQTRDDGALPVIWTGRRRISGARLFATPGLRPVRIRGGAFGIGRPDGDLPDGDLIVSPQHRMLVKGAAVGCVFNTAEVLIAAEDLVNGDCVAVDLTPGDVTYIHFLLDRHAIVMANGLDTESFHPARAALEDLGAADRAALAVALPGIAHDPESYGPYARRSLTASEAAILRHEMVA